jgi:hypothetical protein
MSFAEIVLVIRILLIGVNEFLVISVFLDRFELNSAYKISMQCR